MTPFSSTAQKVAHPDYDHRVYCLSTNSLKDSDRIRVFVLVSICRSQESLSAVQNIEQMKQLCQFTTMNTQSSKVFVNGQSLLLQLLTRHTVLNL